MRKEEREAGEVLEQGGRMVRREPIPIAEQERERAMQRLANAPDRVTYLAVQQEIAEQLNMSV